MTAELPTMTACILTAPGAPPAVWPPIARRVSVRLLPPALGQRGLPQIPFGLRGAPPWSRSLCTCCTKQLCGGVERWLSRLADEAAVDAVLTASRTLVAVATTSLGEAADDITIAQYRALVVLASEARTGWRIWPGARCRPVDGGPDV